MDVDVWHKKLSTVCLLRMSVCYTVGLVCQVLAIINFF